MTTRPPFEEFASRKQKICIIGLGYVGLPLAAAFAKIFSVVGFDISRDRVDELSSGHDRTCELSEVQLRQAASNGLTFTTDTKCLSESRMIIVTVPTPIDRHKNPDLTPLVRASEMIGKYITAGTTVVYESTVYPGCTEEDCLPLIEKQSGLKWKVDFFAGYSPERINPGDKEHTVEMIKKVVSGDTPETAALVRDIYGAVITAGVFVAESIATAEAAKVIENTQRDLNIALMNELALIFDRMGLNTLSVLEAAGTKWNFLPFRPGLVGGHCIGVDPYYLTFKAQTLGYHPEVILAGRKINDQMGKIVAERTVKKLIAVDRPVKGASVLLLGWTFKENVPDIRNSRVIDIYSELRSYGVEPIAIDPHADPVEVAHEYGVKIATNVESAQRFDAIITAVKHDVLVREYTIERIRQLGKSGPPVLIDVKGYFSVRQLMTSGLEWSQL